VIKALWLALVVSAVGCKTDVVCCMRSNGMPVLSQRGVCAEREVPVVSRDVCDGIPDVDLTWDDEDTDIPDPTVDEELVRCQRFCAAEVALCPSDAACLESCEHSACAPDEAAITCAEDAADCVAVGVCWNMPWFSQPPEGDTDEPTCPT
jgi:hypothetical protein